MFLVWISCPFLSCVDLPVNPLCVLVDPLRVLRVLVDPPPNCEDWANPRVSPISFGIKSKVATIWSPSPSFF